MTPFFYEDGRRGYLAVPKIYRLGKGGGSDQCRKPGTGNSISNITPDISEFREQLYESVTEGHDWDQFVDSLTGDPKDGLEKLQGKLQGSCFALDFQAFYHPFVCLMKLALASGGFEKLMHISAVKWNDNKEFKNLFEPQDVVATPYPNETCEFKFDDWDGYASYNWEIFYHLPALISKKLTTSYKFEKAFEWLHYIFNPPESPIQRKPLVVECWPTRSRPPRGLGATG